MEKNKKAFVGLLLTSLLSFSVVPYLNVQAQSCDPNALTPVSYGQRGNAVRNAQLCLMEAGYDIPAGATGYYGAQTRNAVREFYADWYGAWSGNSLGPRGVAQLKSLLASAPQQPQQPQSQTGGVSQDQLQQVLSLLAQGNTSQALALLLALLSGQQPSQQPQQPGQQPQPQTAEEGFLTVEKDPSVGIPTLYEGETARVAGIRFRADNGAVTVKTIFLRWDPNGQLPAPHRIISALTLKDSAGNVLYQTNVGPSTFLQDSNLNYYLPVSGLNVQVPKNGYNSVFVEVTAVGTYPSGYTGTKEMFTLKQNDVRGVDGAGVDRFAPDANLTTGWQVDLQTTVAGTAKFVVAKNVNSPISQLVFANPTNGQARDVKVLTFDVTAKNDNLRLTKIEGVATGSQQISSVAIRQGNTTLYSASPDSAGKFTLNLAPNNFVINRDQTVTFDLLVNFTNSGTATFTVSVATTTGQNSLGDSVQATTTVTSDEMTAIRVGPEVQLVSMTTNYVPPSQSASSSYSVDLTFNVTPRGGTVYMGGTTTAAVSNFIDLKLQKTDGSPVTGLTLNPVVQLKLGNNDVTNTNQTQNISGNEYYALTEGTTYTFVVTAVVNGNQLTGLPQMLRWIVNDLKFSNDASNFTSVPGVSNTFVTNYTNVQ